MKIYNMIKLRIILNKIKLLKNQLRDKTNGGYIECSDVIRKIRHLELKKMILLEELYGEDYKRVKRLIRHKK